VRWFLANKLHKQPHFDEFFSDSLPKSAKAKTGKKSCAASSSTALRDLLGVDDTVVQDDSPDHCHDLPIF